VFPPYPYPHTQKKLKKHLQFNQYNKENAEEEQKAKRK
jgi:hypothetical protein